MAIPCLHLSPCGGSSSISLSFVGGFSLLSLLMVSVSLFYVDERGTITTTRETERRRTEPPPPKNWSGDCPPLSSVSLSLLWWLHSSFFGGSFCFVSQHTSICTHLLLASISRIVSSGSSLVFSHSFVFRARVCLTMTFVTSICMAQETIHLPKHRT